MVASKHVHARQRLQPLQGIRADGAAAVRILPVRARIRGVVRGVDVDPGDDPLELLGAQPLAGRARAEVRDEFAGVRAPGVRFLHRRRAGADDLHQALSPEFHVRDVERACQVAGQDELLGRLPAEVVAADAVPIPDRLNLRQVVEEERLPAERRAGRARRAGGGSLRHVRDGGPAVLVAADAAQRLARPDDRARPHRLHHHLVLIQQLEVDEPVGRDREVRRAVRLDRHGAEDTLVVEIVPVHAGRLRAAAVPIRPGPEPLLGRLDDPQVLHRPPLDGLHARADVHVVDVERAVRLAQVRPVGQDRGPGAGRERHRVEAARRLGVDEHLVAEDVDQVDAHLLPLARLAGAEEILAGRGGRLRVVQRIRVLVLRPDPREGIVVADGDEVAGLRRPGADDGPFAVHPARAVDDGQGAPRPVVARGERGDEPLRAGDRPGVDHPAGRGRVVSPQEGVVRAVRAAEPHALGVAEVAVHVFPPVVHDGPVGHEGGMPLVERAVAHLVHVGPAGVHPEEVAHDMAVAHAELGLAGGGEDDAAVGQVARVDVRDPVEGGQGMEASAVGARRVRRPAALRLIARAAGLLACRARPQVQFVDGVVVARLAADGEEDPLPAEVDVRVAGDAVGHLEQGLDAAAAGQVQQFDGSGALELAGVDLPVLEHRGRVVMVRAVLPADDEEDGMVADQGVGKQGLAGQCFNVFDACLQGLRRRGFHPLPDLVQAGEVRPAVRVSLAERLGEVAHGRAEGSHPAQYLLPRGVAAGAVEGREPLLRGRLIDSGAGAEVVERDVPPAARVTVHDTEEDGPADEVRHVPGHALHRLGVPAAGAAHLLAVGGAERNIRRLVPPAADEKRHLRAAEPKDG